MPVITAEGIVGKVLRTFPTTSLILLINDPTSGAGVILEKSRLQGILKGSSNGATIVHNIMTDEKVEPGDRVLTSGGDRVFPKGLPVGTVMSVGPGQDLFLNIRVKPAAPISRLEEVLVVTKMDERTPEATPSSTPLRAIDILAQRLPTVAPPKPATTESATGEKKTQATELTGAPKKTTGAAVPKISAEKPVIHKPAETAPPGNTAEGNKTAPQTPTAPATRPQDPRP
jgi:rod shape-determining protein MreC